MRENIQIIAFSGKMGSGKTEAINRIISALGPEFPYCTIKFAGPIYAIANAVCEITGVPFEKNKFRPFMQFVGTEFFRTTYGTDFWVDQWTRTYSNLNKSNVRCSVVFCDDVRFDNEADAIRKLGGQIIEVYADPDLRQARGVDISKEGHASEAGVSKQYFTASLINNGTLEQFHAKVDKLAATIKNRLKEGEKNNGF